MADVVVSGEIGGLVDIELVKHGRVIKSIRFTPDEWEQLTGKIIRDHLKEVKKGQPTTPEKKKPAAKPSGPRENILFGKTTLTHPLTGKKL